MDAQATSACTITGNLTTGINLASSIAARARAGGALPQGIMIYTINNAASPYTTASAIRAKRDALWRSAIVPITANGGTTFYMPCTGSAVGDFETALITFDYYALTSIDWPAVDSNGNSIMVTITAANVSAVVKQYRFRRAHVRRSLYETCAAFEKALPWVRTGDFSDNSVWPLSVPTNDKWLVPSGSATPRGETFPSFRRGSNITVTNSGTYVQVDTTESHWRTALGVLPFENPAVIAMAPVSALGKSHGNFGIVVEYGNFLDGQPYESQPLYAGVVLSGAAPGFYMGGVRQVTLPAPSNTHHVFLALNPATGATFYAEEGDSTWTTLSVIGDELARHAVFISATVISTTALRFAEYSTIASWPGAASPESGVAYQDGFYAAESCPPTSAAYLLTPNTGTYSPSGTPSGFDASAWVPDDFTTPARVQSMISIGF